MKLPKIEINETKVENETVFSYLSKKRSKLEMQENSDDSLDEESDVGI